MPHTVPHMRVAGLPGGEIFVLLIGLSGKPPCEEVTDLHASYIFAVIIELNRFPLKKFAGNEKPATRSSRLRFFFLTCEFI